jgi:hypothetical protein
MIRFKHSRRPSPVANRTPSVGKTANRPSATPAIVATTQSSIRASWASAFKRLNLLPNQSRRAPPVANRASPMGKAATRPPATVKAANEDPIRASWAKAFKRLNRART